MARVATIQAPLERRRTRVRLPRNPVLVLCGCILLSIALIAAGAPWLAPYEPNEQHLVESLRSPGSTYLLGTDQGGRDILSRTMYGARVSLAVGFGAMLVGGLCATLLGGVSAYAGGRWDDGIQRVVDAFLSMPALILMMTVVSVLGASILKMIVVIGLWSAISSARTVRGGVIYIKTKPFIEAARASGAGHVRVFLRHILPNVFAPIIVISTLIFGYAILIEASLSFLGYGIAPPTATWGGMLAGDARAYMVSAPWIGIAPGAALTVVVVAINLLGDGLRDALDPRLRMR